MRKLGGYSFKLHQQGVCSCHRARRVLSEPSHHHQHTQGQIWVLSSAWAFRHSQGFKKKQEGFENKARARQAVCLEPALQLGWLRRKEWFVSPSHRNVRRLFCRDNTSQSSTDSVCRLPELSGTSKAIPPAPACLESSFSVGWASRQSRQIGTTRAGQPASMGRSYPWRGHQALDRKAGAQAYGSCLWSNSSFCPSWLPTHNSRLSPQASPRSPGKWAEHRRESGVWHKRLSWPWTSPFSLDLSFPVDQRSWKN